MQPFFSIITVAYNPGEKLKKTIESVQAQSFEDYEVIVKDGGSSDGSSDFLQEILTPEEQITEEITSTVESCFRLIVCPDKGIYDAMNQGIAHARGKYLLFLNCGDYLADPEVLRQVASIIGMEEKPAIYYGDTFSRKLHTEIASPPEINAFTCYRNVPCHQACIYEKSLFLDKQYDTSLSIRADYDHFLYCYFVRKAYMKYLSFPIVSYEGDGVSEQEENQKLDHLEWQSVMRRYMSESEIRRYERYMRLTLVTLRKKMAENKFFTGIYHEIKRIVYKR